MKRIFALLTAALLLLLCGCGPSKNQYKATYLYTGYDSTAPDNQVWVLHSMAELEDYAAGADKRVAEALSAYDEAFFKSHVLFVLKFSMGSSGYRYEVKKIYEQEGITTFQLEMTVKGDYMFTCDMSGMHILVEMDQSWDCDAKKVVIEKQ
jgi:hypothetical protein